MANCSICKRQLEDPKDPLSMDCGGDCTLCMAECDDPDCQLTVIQALKSNRVLERDRERVEKDIKSWPSESDIRTDIAKWAEYVKDV